MNNAWTRQGKFQWVNGNHAVERQPGGWGADVNFRSKRQWAGFIDGDLMRDKAGKVRTFASARAAMRAVEKQLEKP